MELSAISHLSKIFIVKNEHAPELRKRFLREFDFFGNFNYVRHAPEKIIRAVDIDFASLCFIVHRYGYFRLDRRRELGRLFAVYRVISSDGNKKNVRLADFFNESVGIIFADIAHMTELYSVHGKKENPVFAAKSAEIVIVKRIDRNETVLAASYYFAALNAVRVTMVEMLVRNKTIIALHTFHRVTHTVERVG